MPPQKVRSDSEFDAKAFLNGYVGAFVARDVARIASFYHVPCLSVRADGEAHAFTSGCDLEEFFAQVLDHYDKDGMATFVAQDCEISGLGKAAARLTCHWHMRRRDGSPIREWSQTYLFQCSEDGWRIVASVFHQ